MSLAGTEGFPNSLYEYRIADAAQPRRRAKSERRTPRRTMKRRRSLSKRNRLALSRSSMPSVRQKTSTDASSAASMSIQITSTGADTGLPPCCLRQARGAHRRRSQVRAYPAGQNFDVRRLEHGVVVAGADEELESPG